MELLSVATQHTHTSMHASTCTHAHYQSRSCYIFSPSSGLLFGDTQLEQLILTVVLFSGEVREWTADRQGGTEIEK